MDNSKEFQSMLDRAIKSEPSGFKEFDRTKNVQDQLQEMIHDYKFSKRQFSSDHGLLLDFAYWVEEESKLPCASMEQLWLAFCMSEKFGKIWDGESWG